MLVRILLAMLLLMIPFTGTIIAFEIDDTVEWPYLDGNENTGGDGDAETNLAEVLKETGLEESDSVVQRLMTAFGVNYFNEEGETQTATYFVKEVINWALAILGLVALVVLLYAFYGMFFAKDHEEGFTQARKILLNAVIALVVIALAWFITSWLFAVYEAAVSTV